MWLRPIKWYLLPIVVSVALILPPISSRDVIAQNVRFMSVASNSGGPRTDGTHVVFEEEGDIWVVDYFDPEVQYAVPTDSTERSWPDIDGDIVVWMERESATENHDIRGFDFNVGEPFDVSMSDNENLYPSISGNRVVWVSQTESGDRLMMRNISTMAEPVELVSYGPNRRLELRPEIDGDWIVWAAIDYSGQFPQGYGIYARQVGNAQVITLGGNVWDHERPPTFDVGNGVAVYQIGGGLFARSLPGGDEVTIIERHSHGVMSLTTNGRYVFFEDHRRILTTGDVEITGYDMSYGSLFPAIGDTGTNVLPHTSGNLITWQESENGDTGIFAVEIDYLLPTAPFEDPGFTDPAWLYFDKTGHYVSYGFKDFWLRSGGLPVFGYPLTIEYDEMNPELRVYRTAQYFERQRFEYHPENAGTPYETLLGRLGVADARHRGLTSHPAFQPLPPGTTSTSTAAFFAPTRHLVKGRFLDYWRTHGLEFGDPGISYRESLALFGYPISEEFVDPQTRLVTQYFERAVFEYHPSNPDPYKVLLRRLGAEQMNLRDW